ncbi:tetratricopeptide repeat domain-containing protein [Thecamonas trahens ATCC 50062]|uniref:Tetratricopeptide repeat domain-containing protein n=1 Tax=Thecamonas trahens ATCC 50062 TaxID=461836 RepID=A0A0L0DUM8_THETB|nr:tetratricopeptide repeat domain-containing protein [Thecamonas trahens ATCC 50062]KNC55761.1 tetratricopeptide repeat domain-containing protein [Thecamonas trahens ATCC 50062]|eukprot:XP_013752913.1 tetratricopeptide repeat domain-containing protein [Thecamonas trahens ATCC 50062]
MAALQPESALVILTRALFVAPRSARLHFERGALLELLGDVGAAAASFALAQECTKDDEYMLGRRARDREADVRYTEGVRLLKEGDAEGAARWLEAACELKPEAAGMAIHKAAAYLALGAQEAALVVLTQIVDKVESEGSGSETKLAALAMRATLLHNMRRLREAHLDVIRLLRLSPRHRIGLALSRQWDTLQATYRVEAAHKQLNGEMEEAATSLARARELAPDDPALILRECSLARQQGEHETALALLDSLAQSSKMTAVQRKTRETYYALVHNDLGVAAYLTGDHLAAIRAFNNAIKTAPATAAFYINRGDARRDSGKLELAIADYHSAHELLAGLRDTSSTEQKHQLDLRLSVCHDQLGSTEFVRGNYEHAVLEFSQAIKLAPVADYYVHRARAFIQSHDLARLRDDLRAALALDPEHREGVELFARYFPHADALRE